MSDDLIRVEYKLDLIIRALQEGGIMIRDLPDIKGIEQDTCVVCNSKIRLIPNTETGTLERVCKCKLPKTAYKLNTTTKEAQNANIRPEENTISPDTAE